MRTRRPRASRHPSHLPSLTVLLAGGGLLAGALSGCSTPQRTAGTPVAVSPQPPPPEPQPLQVATPDAGVDVPPAPPQLEGGMRLVQPAPAAPPSTRR